MKGLQEALRQREEHYSRSEKHDLSEDDLLQNSEMLLNLRVGMKIYLEYYSSYHDVTGCGYVTAINTVFKFLELDRKKIYFNDIYKILIL